MFDFEKLDVYQKAKTFNSHVYKHIQVNKHLDATSKNQLRRASLSIMLNIAEGSSRFSKADRRNFFVIARGSAFECAAIFDFMRSEQFVDQSSFENFYNQTEELSKMLFTMIRNLG